MKELLYACIAAALVYAVVIGGVLFLAVKGLTTLI